MTKAEKLQKLGNAIREYRGVRRGTEGKWVHPPRLKRRRDIMKWMQRLGRDDPEATIMKAVDGFASFTEMHQWLQKF